MNAHKIAEALACSRLGCRCGKRDSGGWWVTHCPTHGSHGDDGPSLNVKDGDSGWPVIKCFGGCPKNAVIDALRQRGLWPEPSRNRARRRNAGVIRYEIRDLNGVLKAIHARKGDGKDKTLWWERPDGTVSKGGIHSPELPLYGSEKLPDLPEGSVVVVTEGEKATGALWKRGVNAVATVTGAGLTPCDDALKNVLLHATILWPDNDDAGRDHMSRIAEALHRLGHRSIRVLSWPGAPGKGDAADFTGDDAALAALLDSATPYERASSADGIALLDDVRAFVRRFVVLTDAQLDSCALWLLHSHAFDAADCTPYLNIRSPEKESGKTLLLEVLSHLAAQAWFTARTSTAALMRKVDSECPTLLLDETDAAFKGDREYSQALRGMLNAGYRRGGTHAVCDTGRGNVVRDYGVFCPKAFAGIGDVLPDTVRSRSIPIDMKRKAAQERTERFRTRKVPSLAAPIRVRIALWATAHVAALRDAEPSTSDALSDRAADVWEPLFAIADAAGGDWPQRARRAALALSAGRPGEDMSMGVRLLRDIQAVFVEKNTDRMFSADLVTALNAIEEAPWGDWYGKPMGVLALAKMLRPYDVTPKQLRIGEVSLKGYMLTWFGDAFMRYTPRQAETGETPETNSPREHERNWDVSGVSGVSPIGGIHAQEHTSGLLPTDGPLVRAAVLEFGALIIGRGRHNGETEMEAVHAE